MSWPKPRSAYIHVPFCRHRCGYCNFSVVADRDDLLERYLGAIDQELCQIADRANGKAEIETLFIGGGTPTHLPLDLLERFLGMMRTHFQLSPTVEWSIEANPEDITSDKLDLIKAFGVNRVSLGVQSFNDQKLSVLERSHTGESAEAVVHQVASVIDNVSIDLIFAAPGESVADWQLDCKTAAALPIKHVSTYALTFEKGTAFWTRQHRGDLNGVGESDEITMYDLARQVFADAGLAHYEISNFARPGFRCRHNLAYWSGDGWYAAGPGAASFVAGKRVVNHRSTTTYLKRIESGQNAIAESEQITSEQAAREQAAFGVRLIDGIDLRQMGQHLNVSIETLCSRELDRLIAQQLITLDNGLVKLTPRGIHFADTVASELLG